MLPISDIHNHIFSMPEKVYILGPGPNGREYYKHIPEDAYVIAVNRAANIHREIKGLFFKPSVWVVADKDAVKKPYWKDIDKSFKGIRIFSTYVINSLGLKDDFSRGNILSFNVAKLDKSIIKFEPPPRNLFRSSHSVLGHAMWLSQLCGARDIILCGFDLSGDTDYTGLIADDPRHGHIWEARDRHDSQIKYHIDNGMRFRTLSRTMLKTPELIVITDYKKVYDDLHSIPDSANPPASRPGFGGYGKTVEHGLGSEEFIRDRVSVLELGCGRTHFLRNVTKQKDLNNCIALDISDVAVSYQKELGINAMQFDITDPLPFDDKQFDIAISYDTLEHIEQKFVQFAINEMARVSSKLIVSVGYGPAVYNGFALHRTVQTAEWWRNRFEEVGNLLIHNQFFIVEVNDN